MTNEQLRKLCDVIIKCTEALIRSQADESSIWGAEGLQTLPENPFNE